MLKQRIITAVVLLALLLPALIVAPGLAVRAADAGRRWRRRLGMGSPQRRRRARRRARRRPRRRLRAGALRRLGDDARRALAWWLAFAIWVLGGTWVLRAGVAGWPRAAAVAALGDRPRRALAAWLALANAKAIGLNFLLSVFFLVWVADIFAYFGGRAFGRRKLAPAISPGKSWEGVWSGMVGALAGRGGLAGDRRSRRDRHAKASTRSPPIASAASAWRWSSCSSSR